MANYMCTLKFNASKTSVTVEFDTNPPADGLIPGEGMSFTSPDGAWHVIYPESPFHPQPRNAMIGGNAGGVVRMFINPSRKGSHPFRCLIANASGELIGWSDGGGDTNVKTT
jgi:hypothetical protein